MPLPKNPIAYLCAEFGIDARLPIYAGGLGILAGDAVKQAADMDYPFVAVGLLYHGYYFDQSIHPDGWQSETDRNYDLSTLGFTEVTQNGRVLFVVTNLNGTDVWIKAYEKEFSKNTRLFLLTTDCEYNTKEWRDVMIADYCCNDEMQLQQQFILGIGSVKLLKALGIQPSVYHLNEGRPIFAYWELIHHFMVGQGLSYDKAAIKAKETIVYTNHSLLKSANLTFPKEVVKKYASGFVTATGVDKDELVKNGIDEDGHFSITLFALNISKKVSAVSKLHGELAVKDWPQYNWQTITNGVHMPTWQDIRFRKKDLSDKKIWAIHLDNKRKLREFVQNKTGFGYDENRLVISWARRITGYKNPTVLFSDIARLKTIISNADKPVQILIAGKSHYGDDEGKKTIQQIIRHMQQDIPGYALYIPNYDIEVAQHLVSGSDVWLNTPEYGKEACGTSGMKAIANGVLNLTVADGWAYEVNWDETGWNLNPNDLSESVYSYLEDSVIPLYYERNPDGLPIGWLKYMRNSIELAKKFSAERMLNDYIANLYA